MYRIQVLSSGKYHNVTEGNRYCFFRRSAIKLANLFGENNCDIVIEKLVHVGDDFFWSQGVEETRIFEDWIGSDKEDKVFYRPLTKKEYKNLYL